MHTPMCRWCGEFEAGTFVGGSDEFCSADCSDTFNYDGNGSSSDGAEPEWYGMMDDADALASAGWGTDEDYGYYGED